MVVIKRYFAHSASGKMLLAAQNLGYRRRHPSKIYDVFSHRKWSSEYFILYV